MFRTTAKGFVTLASVCFIVVAALAVQCSVADEFLDIATTADTETVAGGNCNCDELASLQHYTGTSQKSAKVTGEEFGTDTAAVSDRATDHIRTAVADIVTSQPTNAPPIPGVDADWPQLLARSHL